MQLAVSVAYIVGAEHTFDISADLQELAHTNVTVVCAGAKSILDLGLTTEYLETFGVPLIGYQTQALPAFFCRTSPFDVSIRLDSAQDIARAMAVKWQTGLNGGLVVANPIPGTVCDGGREKSTRRSIRP
ncbi:Pseudouridine-5'-phosphate glycosidase [Citrobacter koseri]|uniref:Pseudouridine-5'-phosphate glycosidase n=1 Tax=Citrobacter koseri TaxID=545 RepID=A0A3S4KJD5_CITKO|nr:Pseudouridine-5'-phosphate glycosidase [Citrobacter koseri]